MRIVNIIQREKINTNKKCKKYTKGENQHKYEIKCMYYTKEKINTNKKCKYMYYTKGENQHKKCKYMYYTKGKNNTNKNANNT